MSEEKQVDINSLYSTVLREFENDTIQELESDFYKTISKFIGNLRKQEFDGVENKIKESLIKMASELTSLLLNIRIEKLIDNESLDFENLLDEEKYILDAEEERRERSEMILSATINGRSQLLESISYRHKTKTVVVRFLKNMDELVGADLQKYGPFQSEDIATIPYENAQALISKKIVTKVRWED